MVFELIFGEGFYLKIRINPILLNFSSAQKWTRIMYCIIQLNTSKQLLLGCNFVCSLLGEGLWKEEKYLQ